MKKKAIYEVVPAVFHEKVTPLSIKHRIVGWIFMISLFVVLALAFISFFSVLRLQ